ncbi:Peptidase A4 family protein [uncultured archaeon]|nr:Peptidase A4 family protein [uncultured archaeon]
MGTHYNNEYNIIELNKYKYCIFTIVIRKPVSSVSTDKNGGKKMRKCIAYMSLILILSIFTIGTLAEPKAEHKPMIPVKQVGHNSFTSTNWGGYAVTSSGVTDVKGSWIVPPATCSGGSQYSSFWVGIDGFNSNTVEQTGTDSDCFNGVATYYAWYEFYPKFSVTIKSMTVKPGDYMSGEVTYIGTNKFKVTITDINTSATFSTTGKVNSAQRNSAEWIAEAPSSISGILPLANFGTVNYGKNFTGISNTNYATINTVTGNINSFGSNVQEITMVSSPTVIKAQPSALTSDGTGSFSVRWVSS